MRAFLSLLLMGVCWAKPLVYVLATGGTIAGSSASQLSSAYKAGTVGVGTLLKAVPQLKNLAAIQTEQISNIGSQEMDNATLLKLARRTQALLDRPEVHGVVITHGTDTMEESAYFLDLVVHSKKPIVFVGAMRNASSLSADGPLNLYNAIAVAADKQAQGKGVLVVMDGCIHAAREVSKTNTTHTDAFKSLNTGPLGSVLYGQVHFYMQPTRKHTFNSVFNIASIKSLPRVDILYAHENDNPDFIQAALAKGALGIISAGMGNGNLYPSVLQSLAGAVARGVVVVRSSRVGSGEITQPGEINDAKYNFLTSDNLNPSKARILLMVALTKTQDLKTLQQYFLEY
ncbi:type II asparaginase [Helicobacter ailurogastricus]|uniref:type II asparaginase n=1 Tax=Helicobacter ailurogastricus TaxID=1578720 RepID=UPI000CF0596A|nr:type II asparaginase [Helicobacter ailurogastricus]